MINLKRTQVWTLVFLMGLSACTLPGGETRKVPEIKLTIQNTLPLKRRDVPIVIRLDELKKVAPDFSFDAYLVTGGQPLSEIASQADDINYDGQKDELVFLLDFEPQETKTCIIRYTPDNPVAVVLEFHRRTRSGIFPELKGIAVLESDFAAYRLLRNGSIQPYVKKRELLFSVESRFQGDLGYRKSISPELRREFDKNGVSISQTAMVEILKPYSSWFLSSQNRQESYLIRKTDEALDIFKAGALSIDKLVYQVNAQTSPAEVVMRPFTSTGELIGCGGFALWDEKNRVLIAPTDVTDYVRILADGPVRSSVQRIVPHWKLREGVVSLTSTVTVYAGNRWIAHRIDVHGLPSGYGIATGVPYLDGQFAKDSEGGWMWSWGHANANALSTKFGVGVIFPVAQFDGFHNVTNGVFSTLIRPDEEGSLSYYAFSLSGDVVDAVRTKETFEKLVQITATTLNTPPLVQISIVESEQNEKENIESGQQTIEEAG